MNKLVYFLLLLTVFACNPPQKSHIETFSLVSEVFGNERKIRVYLPAAYDGKKVFKVLYMNDGQDLFGEEGNEVKNEWRIDENIDSLIKLGSVEPLIVVGIDHAGKYRGNEYLPWEDIHLNPPIPNPDGELYPKFLLEEVIPAIESKYQVLQGSENRGLGGSSYGGLIALYTAFQQPNQFDFLLIESPSLYVHEQQILHLIDSVNQKWTENIYVGIGTNEIGIEDCSEQNEINKMAVNDVLRLQQLLEEQATDCKQLFVIDSCATHSQKAWAKRFPKALQFLLNRK